MQFNKLLTEFITNLLRVFPKDVKFKLIIKKIDDFTKEPSTLILPVVKFAENMSKTNESGKTIADLILKKNAIIFDSEFGIEFLQDMNISEKWIKLNNENRDIVWSYLIQLLKTSAMFIQIRSLNSESFLNLAQKISKVVDKKLEENKMAQQNNPDKDLQIPQGIDLNNPNMATNILFDVLKDDEVSQATADIIEDIESKRTK